MLRCASLSQKASREINEDCVALRQAECGLLCALADGLGGHGAGEEASRCAVEAAVGRFATAAPGQDGLLAGCMQAAQDAVTELQRLQNRPNDMKTTLVLLHLNDAEARWAHVGDSRLYQFCGERLVARTLDHSVPQMLVLQGEIRERDIRFHEDRNRLTRVVGIEWERPMAELSGAAALVPGMRFLLCSDGFWEYLDEKDMARALRHSAGPEEWLAAMEKIVLKNGSGKKMDNYSAVAVFLDTD